MSALTGTPTAITLAVLGALCFAGAAVLQHRAVSAESDAEAGSGGTGGTLSLRGLRAVARRPGWLTGLALAGSGTALHAGALLLAPLSVVQPIGVLAVPVAVVLTALRSGRRPDRQIVAWVGLSVVGVAAFVVTAARTAVSNQPQPGSTLVAGLIVAALVALLAALGLAREGWVRCIACATAGAVAFGLVSGLVRAASQSITPELAALVVPAVAATLAAIAVAVVVGGWLVQQAFASGPPEVVIACLTVVDPIVAVILGAVLLGEGAATPPPVFLLLAAAAVAAAVGVVGLAKHHPDAAGRGPGRPGRRGPSSTHSRLETSRPEHFLRR
jgi:drug/metabolite transporter (DMT)-like permease